MIVLILYTANLKSETIYLFNGTLLAHRYLSAVILLGRFVVYDLANLFQSLKLILEMQV